jgi:DNA primase
MSVIDEVKQKTDIVTVVSQYVALKKAGRNLIGLCPFHSERNPSFFVYPEQQSWHCFGCNTGGDVFSFITKKEGIDFGEALRLLAQKAGVTITSRPKRDEDREEKERLYKVNEAAANYFHQLLLDDPQAEKARNYVKSRGFTAETVADFQLGFSLNQWHALKDHLLERGYEEKKLLTAGLISESEKGNTYDRFRDKLMFPIWDARGRVVGFGARVLDDSLPKYINSPQTPVFDKSSLLYAVHLASAGIRQQDLAVIVEGYMDTITAHQNGFTNVVASMGTSVTETQIRALKKLTRNIAIAMDADVAGKAATVRGGELAIQTSKEDFVDTEDINLKISLNENEVRKRYILGADYFNQDILSTDVNVFMLPQGKDPDDAIKDNPKTWEQLIENSIPIFDYVFNIVTSKIDVSTAKGKSNAIDTLLPIIVKITDPVRYIHYKQKLASLVNMSQRELEGLIARTVQPSKTRARVDEKQKQTTSSARAITSSRLEEDYLAFLLQRPEFRGTHEAGFPEYFTQSENREIFIAWQSSDDTTSLRENLDPAMQEHFDVIAGRSIITDQTELRDADYRRRLQERYYKNLAAKEEEALRLEVELKGAGADLARLETRGSLEITERLKELSDQTRRKRLESRR